MSLRAGIDVGSNSVGLALVRVGDNGQPIELVNAVVHIHDGGVDPTQQKRSISRRAESGQARRVRRLIRRRKARYAKLDDFIRSRGWPIVENDELPDPYAPWRIRAALATERVADADERDRMLSIALRHLARHRGWRNPYSRAESLLSVEPASSNFVQLRARLKVTDEESTPAQVVCAAALDGSVKAWKQRVGVGR